MYEGWVFGAFSKGGLFEPDSTSFHLMWISLGWTRGFVSKVFSFEDRMPTILEGLLYWFASAAGIKGGWQIPEVSGDLPGDIEIPCVVYDLMGSKNRRPCEDAMAIALSLIP